MWKPFYLLDLPFDIQLLKKENIFVIIVHVSVGQFACLFNTFCFVMYDIWSFVKSLRMSLWRLFFLIQWKCWFYHMPMTLSVNDFTSQLWSAFEEPVVRKRTEDHFRPTLSYPIYHDVDDTLMSWLLFMYIFSCKTRGGAEKYLIQLRW